MPLPSSKDKYSSVFALVGSGYHQPLRDLRASQRAGLATCVPRLTLEGCAFDIPVASQIARRGRPWSVGQDPGPVDLLSVSRSPAPACSRAGVRERRAGDVLARHGLTEHVANQLDVGRDLTSPKGHGLGQLVDQRCPEPTRTVWQLAEVPRSPLPSVYELPGVTVDLRPYRLHQVKRRRSTPKLVHRHHAQPGSKPNDVLRQYRLRLEEGAQVVQYRVHNPVGPVGFPTNQAALRLGGECQRSLCHVPGRRNPGADELRRHGAPSSRGHKPDCALR